jgi:hypothetical protein
MFESDDIKLISKTDNSFMLTKKDFAVDDIDLSDQIMKDQAII